MVDGELPQPPPEHGLPGLIAVRPAAWWRVHAYDATTGRYGATAFNESDQANARFSPLRIDGKLIPVLYAAATLEASLMETVLHDVPYPSEGYIYDFARDLEGPLHVSQIDLSLTLRMVDLTKLGFQRLGLRPSKMFETNADDYPRTRRWSYYFHRQSARADGLVWMSARQPEARAIMLFGDRHAARALSPGPDGPRPLRDLAVQQALLHLLGRLGCGVAPDR